MKRLIVIAILVSSSSCVFAQDDGAWYTGMHFGVGHIDVGTESDRSFGFNLSLGYRFSPGFLAEVGASFQTSDDIFGNGDSYDLKREEVMLGYQIKLGDTLRLIPKIGRLHWDLHSRDGSFINLDEDQESLDLGEANDDIAELVLEFRVSDLVQLDITYEKIRYGFGESRLAEFGARFEY